MHRTWQGPLLIAAAITVAGCAGQTNIEPAPQAREIAPEDAAVATANGVRMRVQADTWPGAQGVTDEVTPMQVQIQNNSDQPLMIRYSEFALVTPGGQRYAALPPFRIEGTISEPAPAAGHAPIAAPGFRHRGFAVAPAYRPLYPTMSPYASPFAADPLYYDNYYGYWDTVELPTEDMLEVALPEGVLSPGGNLDGYLYFEKVPEDQRLRLEYQADLVNAETGRVFAELDIPFIANPQG